MCYAASVQIRACVARFACFMSVSGLYEWLWNINRSMFQMKNKIANSISKNITVRRFNAIKLNMYHRAPPPPPKKEQ